MRGAAGIELEEEEEKDAKHTYDSTFSTTFQRSFSRFPQRDREIERSQNDASLLQVPWRNG